VLPNYRTVDDLATVWCAYADMELRHDHYEEALAVMTRATTGMLHL
jgi:pre-mRNA-splicing factor SYF1